MLRPKSSSKLAELSCSFYRPTAPDLNPIEMMWAKVKAHLRQAKARTDADLLASIGQALQTISTTDAQGFFRHAGYMCTIC